MEPNSIQEVFIKHGETKRGADVYYRESWECFYFSLLGKCFGMMTEDFITLKGDPDNNTVLRETYSDITPGYYSNKVHWNSIILNSNEVTEAQIKEFIDDSYELVYQKLSKKDKLIVDEMKGKE